MLELGGKVDSSTKSMSNQTSSLSPLSEMECRFASILLLAMLAWGAVVAAERSLLQTETDSTCSTGNAASPGAAAAGDDQLLPQSHDKQCLRHKGKSEHATQRDSKSRWKWIFFGVQLVCMLFGVWVFQFNMPFTYVEYLLNHEPYLIWNVPHKTNHFRIRNSCANIVLGPRLAKNKIMKFTGRRSVMHDYVWLRLHLPSQPHHSTHGILIY